MVVECNKYLDFFHGDPGSNFAAKFLHENELILARVGSILSGLNLLEVLTRAQRYFCNELSGSLRIHLPKDADSNPASFSVK